MRRLRHRSAEEAAELLLAALGKRRGRAPGVEAWPDERTGALVLRAPPDEMADARALLAEIDRPVQGRGQVGVLAAALRGSRGAGQAARETSRRAGLPVPRAARWRAEPPRPPRPARESLEGRDFGVAVHAPTHSLVLRADPETLGILQDVIDELDRPPPTIDVEVIVLQVINDAALDLGFDAFIPLTTPKSPHDWIASALLNPSGGGLFQPGAATGRPTRRASRARRW